MKSGDMSTARTTTSKNDNMNYDEVDEQEDNDEINELSLPPFLASLLSFSFHSHHNHLHCC